uniref:Uncharacterized protein n=1 Tax=Oryza rufipogon TaxID=4529 RepID=A0A0E0Q6P2_ORYRU
MGGRGGGRAGGRWAVEAEVKAEQAAEVEVEAELVGRRMRRQSGRLRWRRSGGRQRRLSSPCGRQLRLRWRRSGRPVAEAASWAAGEGRARVETMTYALRVAATDDD